MLKKNYLYIILGIIIVIIYSVVLYLFLSPSSEELPNILPTPTRVEPSTFKENLSPLEKVQISAKEGKLLTKEEKAIRDELTNQADPTTGEILKQESFALVYLQSYDTFQVRILSDQIADTEQKAINWFLTRGLSLNGICKLPVIFYINTRLVPKNESFNPIPEHCR